MGSCNVGGGVLPLPPRAAEHATQNTHARVGRRFARGGVELAWRFRRRGYALSGDGRRRDHACSTAMGHRGFVCLAGCAVAWGKMAAETRLAPCGCAWRLLLRTVFRSV